MSINVDRERQKAAKLREALRFIAAQPCVSIGSQDMDCRDFFGEVNEQVYCPTCYAKAVLDHEGRRRKKAVDKVGKV